MWSLKDGDLESEEEQLGRMNKQEGDKTTRTVLQKGWRIGQYQFFMIEGSESEAILVLCDSKINMQGMLTLANKVSCNRYS